MKTTTLSTIYFSLLAFALPAGAAVTVNVDFSRDITNGANPGPNPAPVLYVGTGPAPDSGTSWNDAQVPLTGDGSEVIEPATFSDLTASDGTTGTSIDVDRPRDLDSAEAFIAAHY